MIIRAAIRYSENRRLHTRPGVRVCVNTSNGLVSTDTLFRGGLVAREAFQLNRRWEIWISSISVYDSGPLSRHVRLDPIHATPPPFRPPTPHRTSASRPPPPSSIAGFSFLYPRRLSSPLSFSHREFRHERQRIPRPRGAAKWSSDTPARRASHRYTTVYMWTMILARSIRLGRSAVRDQPRVERGSDSKRRVTVAIGKIVTAINHKPGYNLSPVISESPGPLRPDIDPTQLPKGRVTARRGGVRSCTHTISRLLSLRALAVDCGIRMPEISISRAPSETVELPRF